MQDEKLCLRWNYFEENIGSAFREFRDNKEFFDMTLACDGEQQIQAHKVILSACSPFFRNVLNRNPHQHPLLYLKGVKYTDLQAVLSFMYQGEVNVAHEELNSFLAVGEDLKVKGLTQYTEDPPTQREPTSFKSQSQKPKKIQKQTSSISQQPTKHPKKAKAQESDILEVITKKYEPCEILERNLTATPPNPQAPGACNPPPLVTMAEQMEALFLYQEEEVVTEVNNNKPTVGTEEYTQVKHKKRKKSKDKNHSRIKHKKKKKKSKDGGEIINKLSADVTDHQQKKNESKEPAVTPRAQVDVTDIGVDMESSMDSLPPDQDHSIMSPHHSQTPEPCEILERNLTATPPNPQAPEACNPPPLVTMSEQKEALVLYQEEEVVVTEVNINKPDVDTEEYTQVKHKKRKKSKDKDHPRHTTHGIKHKKKKKKSIDGGEIISKLSGVAADVTDYQQKKNKSKEPAVTPSAQVDVTDITDDMENSRAACLLTKTTV